MYKEIHLGNNNLATRVPPIIKLGTFIPRTATLYPIRAIRKRRRRKKFSQISKKP